MKQLIELFGLTPAEARVAKALATGTTLEDYAAAENLKLPTVKTQLREVFAKTNTRRQAALVGLLNSIPAIRS
jgi:DNA-binding CsgD family transcriptional regulator